MLQDGLKSSSFGGLSLNLYKISNYPPLLPLQFESYDKCPCVFKNVPPGLDLQYQGALPPELRGSLGSKYTVLIKMNISKESINWLLMPKKDDQLLTINELRQGKISNGPSTQNIQVWENWYKFLQFPSTLQNLLSLKHLKLLK